MKHLLALSIAFILLFTACNKETAEKAEEQVTKVTLAELNSGTYEYKGGKVEVEGLCTHVCAHSGKKLFLVGDNDEMNIQIFAAEGLSGFPKELEGSKVSAIGTLEEEKLDMEYANKLEAETKAEVAVADDPEHSCAVEETMKKVADLKAKIQKSPKGYISKYSMTSKDFKKI